MMQYQLEYNEFITNYKKGTTDAEDIGIMISRLAQYFAEINNVLGERWKKIVEIAAAISQQTDSLSGKTIAVNKSEILINATPEAALLNDSKIDISNLEQMINALKSLQRGSLNEYSHMGNI